MVSFVGVKLLISSSSGSLALNLSSAAFSARLQLILKNNSATPKKKAVCKATLNFLDRQGQHCHLPLPQLSFFVEFYNRRKPKEVQEV